MIACVRSRAAGFCYDELVAKVTKSEQSVAEAFAMLVGRRLEDERIDLARAALTIARTEYPELDIRSCLIRVDELARRVRARSADLGDTAQTISALNAVLFEEENFRGNRDDYYDPRNSFLNEVLD